MTLGRLETNTKKIKFDLPRVTVVFQYLTFDPHFSIPLYYNHLHKLLAQNLSLSHNKMIVFVFEHMLQAVKTSVKLFNVDQGFFFLYHVTILISWYKPNNNSLIMFLFCAFNWSVPAVYPLYFNVHG